MRETVGLLLGMMGSFMNLCLGVKWFGMLGKDFWMIGCVLAGILLIPRANFFHDRDYYVWADSWNAHNPLYNKGYFRKNTGNTSLWANVKGLYYCQIALVIVEIPIWGCLLYYKKIPLFFYKKGVIIFVGSLFWIIFLVWFGFRVFYAWSYNESFRYTEENGIWKPFSHITKYCGLADYRPFRCSYFISKEKIRTNLRKSCQKNGYQFVDSIDMNGEFSDSYLRVKDGELQIFQVIQMSRYTEEKMERQNEIFANLWKNKIWQRYKTENISFSFLLCVEVVNEELEHCLLNIQTVDQKKGRNRLVAVLKFDEETEYPILEVLDKYGIWRGKRKYCEMREDFLKLMGLNEQYNEW